jgi:hypothetical protein
MAKTSKKATNEVFEIKALRTQRIIFNIVGETPLIMHRFDFKAWQELLLPSRTKNKAEREQSLKHDPIAEYRGCFYLNRNPNAPTRFHIPEGMIKGAIANAALDIPGATKASIDRLVNIGSKDIYLYGIPQIYCAMTRNSDMARTPDVRTRPIFPRWAIPNIAVDYISDVITEGSILNLASAGGMIIGMGDWRPQRKGGGFGRFRICNADDPDLKDIMKREGRAAQEQAYDKPTEYNEDTSELLSWFFAEISRREKDLPSAIADEEIDTTAH